MVVSLGSTSSVMVLPVRVLTKICVGQRVSVALLGRRSLFLSDGVAALRDDGRWTRGAARLCRGGGMRRALGPRRSATRLA